MTPEQEQQMFDTVESISVRLDQLTTDVEKLDSNVKTLDSHVKTLDSNVERLNADIEKFNDRFSNYQQATQWVVQLAFSLIASATVVIIISSVFVK